MWFDLHADIGYDIYKEHLLGNDNRFQEYHLPRLLKDKVSGVCVACFFGDYESWEVMQDCVLFARNQILNSDVQFVLSKEDLKSDKFKVILTIEGMYGIQDDVANKIQWLYDQGVRIGSLCWNEENALATGVRGTVDHGITALGREAILKMKELGMILDVSHLNDKSFFDVIEYDIPIIATHSNARALCSALRNLSDEQLEVLKKRDTLVGLNAYGNFVNDDESLRDCKHLVEHAKYLESKLGFSRIACGFDFMDFYDPNTFMLADMQNSSELHNLESALSKVYNKKDILRIASLNTLDFLKKYL